MRLNTIPVLLIIAAFAIGCKPADNSGSTATAAPTKTADATADTAAPAASGNSIVGTWTSDDANSKDAVYEYKEDGTASMSGTDPKGIKMEAKATYKLDGDKMTITPVAMSATAPEGADAAVKKEVDDTNKMMSPETLKKMPVSVETISWKDKDTFTTTKANGGKDAKVTTFKRKS